MLLGGRPVAYRGRMTPRRRRLLLFLAALLALAAYPFLVEPRWLEVTEHRIEADVQEGLRIAFIGDLHTPAFGGIERAVLDAIAEAKPDLILLGGDLVHGSGARAPVEAFLERLPQTPLGAWMVPGNWEHWTLGDDVATYFRPGRARWLVNTSTTVRPDVWIAGLDDHLSGRPAPRAALAGRPQSGLRIGLLHSPSGFAPFFGQVDLALGAHTHGGQIRLPFGGALVLPPGSEGYEDGWVTRRGTQIFVTRGVGMSVLPARLFCRPEVAIIDVVPKERGHGATHR